MKNFFLEAKTLTILLSVIYIFGLIASFYNFQIFLSIIVFLFLSTIIFAFDFSPKKAVILFLTFYLGVFQACNSTKFDDKLKDISADNVILKGQIISSKNISNKTNRIKFFVNANEVNIINDKKITKYDNLKHKIFVTLDLENSIENKIIIGDYIELNGKLRYPKPATNPHQFDYKRYLLNNNCTNIFYGDFKTLKITKEPNFSYNFSHEDLNDNWFFILKKFELTRIKILKKHSNYIRSDRLKILGGLVFGNETVSSDEKIKEDFKNSGLLHLIAASGLNVALIYGIWWYIASLIKFPYRLSILTGAVFVILYTFMTGFPPSIIRAAIFILFVLFGKLIDRKANSVALIFFAGFLMLLFNPKMLFDVGFELSFVVTFGLIICCPVVIDKFKKQNDEYIEKHKNKPWILKQILYLLRPNNIISAFLVPFVAQLWVIPLQMHYFNNFAPLSVLANVAVIPFIGILSFIGFFSSIVALIPVLNDPIVFIFDSVANPLLWLLIKISEFFASFKFSIVSVFGLNFAQIFIFWGIVLLFTLNLKNNFENKKYKIFLFIFSAIFALSFIKTDIFSKSLEISMFDVENADCFLIKTPKHKYIMIDTGRKIYRGVSSAEMIINKYLKNERIINLEYLIVTHFDIDHAGGAIDILNNVKTNKVILQEDNRDIFAASEIFDYLNANKIDYSLAKNNETIYIEPDLKLTIFKPEINENLSQSSKRNETSVIELLTYKDKNILFMADAGILGYESIKKYLPEKIDILKVGHHGALSVVSNSMLKKIRPDYALISSAGNDFNHPHYKTLNLLYENNVKIFSSKDFGFTKITIDDKLNFSHFNKFNHKSEKIFIPVNKNEFDKSLYMKNFIKDNFKK